ncbi:MAG: hypothetical protein IKI58_10330 [Oscillospiraceae bacterium]|nr:hypothetical protein [Oscillospiraceae bacterium]
MKLRKLFAFLSAGVLGCCALGGTAFAEETEPVDLSQYQMGDINMDGQVDLDDAQLALRTYVFMLAQKDVKECLGVTEEQIKLADVISYSTEKNSYLDAADAQVILEYYTDQLSEKSTADTISEFIQACVANGIYGSIVIANDWR